jgi:hypothetical protein
VPDNSTGTLRFAKRVDDGHTQQVLKTGGKDMGSIDMVISADGKVMTCVYRSVDDGANFEGTYVYDKQ